MTCTEQRPGEKQQRRTDNQQTDPERAVLWLKVQVDAQHGEKPKRYDRHDAKQEHREWHKSGVKPIADIALRQKTLGTVNIPSDSRESKTEQDSREGRWQTPHEEDEEAIDRSRG